MIAEVQQIDVEFAAELKCPITFQKMKRPVSTETGHTFEKKAIKKWMKKSSKSPLSGVKFISNELTKNILIQKAIQNYSQIQMIMLPQCPIRKNQLFQWIKPIFYLKDQINLLKKQISDLLSDKTDEKILIDKKQYEAIHRAQQQQTVLRYNIYVSSPIYILMGLFDGQKQNKKLGKIEILKQIFIGFKQNEIQKYKFYSQNSQQTINQIQLESKKKISLSQGSYKLYIRFNNKNLTELVRYDWPEDIQIQIEQFKIFLENIHQAFPNLKILTFNQCKIKDQGWQALIQNIDNLKHIQSLNLQKNKISNVTMNELTQLDKITRLSYFSLQNNKSVTKQSRKNLSKLKSLHRKQIKIRYA